MGFVINPFRVSVAQSLAFYVSMPLNQSQLSVGKFIPQWEIFMENQLCKNDNNGSEDSCFMFLTCMMIYNLHHEIRFDGNNLWLLCIWQSFKKKLFC